jgi:hypothetical protein
MLEWIGLVASFIFLSGYCNQYLVSLLSVATVLNYKVLCYAVLCCIWFDISLCVAV